MIGLTPMELVILGLATWRLSHMISREHGPWHIFGKLKTWAGAQYAGPVLGWQALTFWGMLFSCPLCLSVWVAGLLYLSVLYWPASWIPIAVLAVSGISCLGELYVSKR